MKKAVSCILVFAVCLTMALTAFAADNSAVEDLKNFVQSAQGLSASEKASAVAFLDEYVAAGNTGITADTVASVKALYNEALAAGSKAQTDINTLNGYIERAEAIAASAGVDLTITLKSIEGDTATAVVTASANGVSAYSVEPSLVGDSIVPGTATGSSGSASVIKPTGIDTASVAVMMAGVFCVLTVAAVSVKKLGLAVR